MFTQLLAAKNTISTHSMFFQTLLELNTLLTQLCLQRVKKFLTLVTCSAIARNLMLSQTQQHNHLPTLTLQVLLLEVMLTSVLLTSTMSGSFLL